jgi:hypothetical protein
VTPNAFKAGKLYSIKGADLDVVRATSATRVNAEGLIETVANNVPRLDYSNGSCPSILVEPQRTNLVFPSDVATTQTRTVTAVAHTLSFYGTGTVVLAGVAIDTLNGTGVNNRVTLTFTPTAGSLILTVTGSVTDWQLEAGSNATSYIPTVATAVTRNADLISKTGITDLIGQSEGTLFVEVKAISNLSSGIICLHLNNTNANRLLLLFNSVTNQISFISTVSGVVEVNSTFTVPNLSTNFAKIAYAYAQNNSVFFINGVKVGEDLICNTFPDNTLQRLTFANANNTAEFFGDIKATALFKTKLTDQECINLTTL